MTHAVTLINGDGIGPEVIRSAVDIIEASGVKISFDEQMLGERAYERTKEILPLSTINSIKSNGVALKGPTTTPIASGHRSANVLLRKELDLYASIRPVKSIPGVITRYSDVDIVVVRENTEGLYSGQEFEIHPGCVISLRTMTEKGCTRIAHAAFSFAQKNHRKKVCVVHKANILKMGDGLLLKCANSERKKFPESDYSEMIIDAFCMKVVTDPTLFEVVFLENMFGDIVSDLCAGLVGGLGLVPGANLGEKYAVFEPVHGSAPDIAGKNLANPTATIQSVVMMLRHLGEHNAARRIETALLATLAEKHLRTRELGGDSTTQHFTKHIIDRLLVTH